MAIDLSNYSLGDLRNLQDQIKTEMKNRETQELQKAREQILAIAQSVGVPLSELIGKGGKSNTKSSLKGAPGAIKYRHPEEVSKEWTGRGRQPRWVKEFVATGKSLDDIRVA